MVRQYIARLHSASNKAPHHSLTLADPAHRNDGIKALMHTAKAAILLRYLYCYFI
jgi:hypothetical protein